VVPVDVSEHLVLGEEKGLQGGHGFLVDPHLEGIRLRIPEEGESLEEAVTEGLVTPQELVGPTDEELLYRIQRRAGEEETEGVMRLRDRWLPALRNRRLPKRALELTAADLAGVPLPDWLGSDSPAKRTVEDDLARELELAQGEVVVDYPAKSAMFQLDLLLERRGGEVIRVGPEGLPGVIDLPRVAQELYRTARVLRVFTMERRHLSMDAFLDKLTPDPGE